MGDIHMDASAGGVRGGACVSCILQWDTLPLTLTLSLPRQNWRDNQLEGLGVIYMLPNDERAKVTIYHGGFKRGNKDGFGFFTYVLLCPVDTPKPRGYFTFCFCVCVFVYVIS